MPIPLTVSNGIKVYNLTADKRLPAWSKKPRRKAVATEDSNNMELLQDFAFPCACTKLKVSPDGEFLAAAGNYKPQIKVFDLSQLSIKFERHVDAEIEDFLLLSTDYSKLVLLRSDRFLEFHTRFGNHHKTKIPRSGRNLVYNPFDCELAVTTNSSLVYVMDLEEGRFKPPMRLGANDVRFGAYHSHYNFYCFGSDDGAIEVYDPRSDLVVVRFDVCKTSSASITKIAFDVNKKLSMAIGTSSGEISVFDIRSKTPLFVRDHRNGESITELDFHSSGRIISSDTKSIKIWEVDANNLMASIITPSDINSFCIYPNSGLIFAALEDPKGHSYFIPSLGEAPKWCSFLENITEELEEEATKTVYDDYKFVTKDELKEIDGEHLLGTDQLRPYMHGFFMNFRLYARMKAVVSKTELKEFLKETRRKKINAKLQERITSARRPFKGDAGKAKEAGECSHGDGEEIKNTVEDARFNAMFDNADFLIDVRSEEYRQRYTTARRCDKKK